MSISSKRIQRGWTQDDLAERSGVSVRTIQRIEKSGKLSLSTRSRLAAVLGEDSVLSILDANTPELVSPGSPARSYSTLFSTTTASISLFAVLTVTLALLLVNQASLERLLANVATQLSQISARLAAVELFSTRSHDAFVASGSDTVLASGNRISASDASQTEPSEDADRVRRSGEETEASTGNLYDAVSNTPGLDGTNEAQLQSSAVAAIELMEQRAQYLADLASPETQLKRLSGLSENNLNLFLDSVADSIAEQDFDADESNHFAALQSARDGLLAELDDTQIDIIDRYIDNFERQQDEILAFERSLIEQLNK